MTRPSYDTSYPPSLFGPPKVNATGATAGIPGIWTPPGSTPPASQAQAIAWGVVASPATPWTTGQFVQTGTAGAAGRITWSGTDWVGGAAPLTAGEVSSMTIEAIKEFIEYHPDLLSEVYAFELAGSARVTLLAWLKALLDEEAAKQQ